MTHAERIIEYIQKNGSITPLDFTKDIGGIDLARTISYMRRKLGYTNIIGTREEGVNRFGEPVYYYRYTLSEEGSDEQ